MVNGAVLIICCTSFISEAMAGQLLKYLVTMMDEAFYSPAIMVTVSKDSIGIVVADGHPVTLKGIQYILVDETAFCVLEACTNGADAFTAVRHHQPQLSLLDLDLPDRCALTVMAEIAHLNLPVKIILFASRIINWNFLAH